MITSLLSALSGVKIYLIAGAVALVLALAAYAYIEHQSASIATLKASIGTLSTANNDQKAALASLQQQVTAIAKAQDAFQSSVRLSDATAASSQATIAKMALTASTPTEAAALAKQINDASDAQINALMGISK